MAGDISPEQVFDLPQHGEKTNETELGIDDIHYYKDHPEILEKSSKLQSKLIAIIQKYQLYTGLSAAEAIPSTPQASERVRAKYKKAADKKRAEAEPWRLPKTNKNAKGKRMADDLREKKALEKEEQADALMQHLEDHINNAENLRDLGLLAQAANEVLNDLGKSIRSAAGRKQSVSSPSPKSQSAERGEYPPEITSLIDRLFSIHGGSDIQSRMQVVTDVSEFVLQSRR